MEKVNLKTQNLKKEVEAQTKDLQIKTLQAQEATIYALEAKEDAQRLRQAAEKHAIELQELD